MVSTKLCDLGSGVKHGKFTILFMFGIDPGGAVVSVRRQQKRVERNEMKCEMH